MLNSYDMTLVRDKYGIEGWGIVLYIMKYLIERRTDCRAPLYVVGEIAHACHKNRRTILQLIADFPSLFEIEANGKIFFSPYLLQFFGNSSANEKQIKNATIRVKTNEKFGINGDTQQHISFTEPSEKMVYFNLKVKEIGVGKITVEAVSGGEKSTYEVEMDVYNPNPKIYQVKNVIIQPNSSQSVNFEVFGERGTNASVLEVSSFPGVNLSQRLKYLIEYPHGCGEQLTSGGFPQLYLSDFENLSTKQQSEVQYNVSATIKKLSENQLPNGGFSYWQGSDYADEWVTSYIGQFYIEAEKKGFSLPIGSKSKWINYQKTMARNWVYNGSYSTFNQAYRLYVLALAKSPDMASMNRLRESSNLSNEALSRLAAAYAIAGQKNVAESLFRKVTFDNSSEDSYYGYGSPMRNQAMSLETALLLGKSQIAAELALKISDKLSSNEWLSTQTTAYGLYLLPYPCERTIACQSKISPFLP